MTLPEWVVRRDFRGFPGLLQAGNDALRRAAASEDGLFYALVTAMLYSIFALEAHLNYAGQKRLPQSWHGAGRVQPVERALSVQQKVLLLLEISGHTLDLGRRPYQTLGCMAAFRSAIAHPKPEHLEHSVEIPAGIHSSFPPKPPTRLESMVTTKTATRFLRDAQDMIEDVNAKVLGERVEWLQERSVAHLELHKADD